jgi:hypothetical protein
MEQMKEEYHNKKVKNKRKKAEVENLRCRNGKAAG